MKNTSVINHPESSPLVMLRSEYLEITGNHCAAKLLAIFEFWTNKLRKMGTLRDWIYKPLAKLQDELMGEHGINTIRKAISILEEKGFIEKRHNPHVKYDRTFQYRINIENVQKALHSLIYPDEQMEDSLEINASIHADESICPDGNLNNIEVNINNNSNIPTQTQEFKDLKKEEVADYVAKSLNIPVHQATRQLYFWTVQWIKDLDYRDTIRETLRKINLSPDVLNFT